MVPHPKRFGKIPNTLREQVEIFAARIRERLSDIKAPVAKSYLRAIVSEVLVTKDEIKIFVLKEIVV
jgi:hypothetical protein